MVVAVRKHHLTTLCGGEVLNDIISRENFLNHHLLLIVSLINGVKKCCRLMTTISPPCHEHFHVGGWFCYSQSFSMVINQLMGLD